jgi:hypothetical protein
MGFWFSIVATWNPNSEFGLEGFESKLGVFTFFSKKVKTIAWKY